MGKDSKKDGIVPIRPVLPEMDNSDKLNDEIASMRQGDKIKKVCNNSAGTTTVRVEKYDSGVRVTLSASGKRVRKADCEKEIKQRYSNGERIKDIAEDLGISTSYASKLRRK